MVGFYCITIYIWYNNRYFIHAENLFIWSRFTLLDRINTNLEYFLLFHLSSRDNFLLFTINLLKRITSIDVVSAEEVFCEFNEMAILPNKPRFFLLIVKVKKKQQTHQIQRCYYYA